ncbi:E3 ubiquitin-protein ligase TRIM71-like [Mercenaria mercenaria]|uniref:E3 ubiquitin-protein ligase TRIM71-like n=1 Tax=Mercenaria mercenaria TaxID=6596 RepID=UPI00234EC682|nr:E3 ubiquitin-protein ligase TRIM71-like [Mercenaria mercenaria]
MAVPGKKMPKTFSSSSTMGSDEDLKVYCQPCDFDGPRLPAHGYCVDCKEHLCETCFRVHKRHTLSRHHTLLDKYSMPQSISSVSVHPTQPDNFTKSCPKHTKEIIKFYCQNHKALLCSVCVTLEHTGTSCKVNYIPDISGQVINSKEHQDILKAMDNITEQCRKKSEDVKKITAKSNSSLTDVLADIKKFRTEINQRLDELERQAEDAAKTIQKENNTNLKTVETTCDDVTKSLKTSSDTIKHLNTTKQADKLFMELKLAKQMITDHEKSVHHLAAYDVKEYNFKENKAILTLLDKESSLGTFAEKSLKQPSPPPHVDIKSRQTSHQGKICVKISKDKNRCWIRGMFLLNPDLLIITDWSNTAVKMVDTSSQSVTDQLQLGTRPQDVISVTSTELAVTLPDYHNIQLISASSNKLKKKQTLKVDGPCYGISYCQGKLFVSFTNPAKLQILDTNGTVLTTVEGETIFNSPLYVTTNTNSIYVSDWMMKTITRLNWQGEVIGSYGGMISPFGITLSDDGTVFVCDPGRNVIEEIAGDCSTGKVVLKDLNGPSAVCWCAETCKLYFSCDTCQDKHDNFLQVFKLS